MMKRTRGIIAIFLLLALLLTACGQSSQTPTVVDEPENTTPVVVEPVQQEDTAAEPLVFTDQPANVFRAKFEGANVAGKGEAVDGVYRFTATKTDGEAWHVKLESNYMTVPGRDYRVTYHFNSDVAGTVKFGDFHEFAIRKGENSVTGQVSASNGYTYLDLQLGALKPFTIDFTSIEVEELETEADYESVMTVPVAWSSEGAVYVQHDPGYFYKLDRHLDGVTMKVEEIPFSAEVWMSRLYVKTAAILAPGALYRVSADVSATHEMDMEVCFNNGDNEKGYGAFYGQRMGDMSKRTFQQLIDLRAAGSEGGEVVLQFAFGKSPDGSQVTVDNIRVEKVYEHYTNMLPAYFAMNGSVDLGTEYVMVPTNYTAIPLEKFSFDGTDSVYTGTNDGFAMSLVETEGSATAAMIEKKTDENEVWTGRVYVKTGVIPEAGAKYRVSATVQTDEALNYELIYTNGSDAREYAGLRDAFLGEGETKTVTTDFTAPADGCEELVLKLQMGKSPLHNKVTISDVQVQKVSKQPVLLTTVSAPAMLGQAQAAEYVAQTVTLGTQSVFWDGSQANSEVTNGAAKLYITKPRNEGIGGIWSVRLHAGTGVTLEAGEKYRISAKIASEKAIHAEVLLSNGYDEDDNFNPGGQGYSTELEGFDIAENGEATYTKEITVPERSEYKELVLRVQVGNSLANTVTVSDVTVEKWTEPAAEPAAEYVAQTVTLVTQSIFWDGSQANSEVTNGAAKLYITKPRNEGIGGIWSVRLHAGTGVTLEAGEKYRISAKITSEKAIHAEVLLSNGYDEDDNFNPGGQGYSTELEGFDIAENGEATYTKEITVPERSEYKELVLRVQVGNSPANTVTVSDVTVEKWTEPAAEPAAEYVAQTVTLGTQSIFWDGSQANSEVTNGAAKLYITKPRNEGIGGIWSVRLHAGTGVTLEAGEKYRISAKIASEKAIHAEVLLSNGYDEDDNFNPGGQGYSTELEGFDIAENGEATYTKEITVPERSEYKELVLRVQVGNSPANTVTVSDVTVEKWTEPDSEPSTPTIEVVGDNLTADLKYDSVGSFSFNADEGYVTHLEKSADSVLYAISQAPDGRNPWNVKLNVRTGVFPKSGVGYRVKFDIEATQNQQLFEVFYDGNREAGFGQLFDQRLVAGQKKTVSYIVNGNSGLGELVIQIRLGKTDGKAGNIYKISNVTMEEVKFGYAPNQITRSTSELWTHEDYAGTLSTTATSATVRMTTVPAQGKEAWKTKLFVETGAKLQAGQKYRITLTTSGSEGMPYEVCLNHGGEEKGLGGIFGLSAMADGDTITYVTTPDKDIDLVLQFSLGNAWTGGSFTVRNIKVEKAGASSTVSNVTYTF